MLTPRLRRRLSELARTPASPCAGVRGGLAASPAAPPPAARDGETRALDSPLPSPEPPKAEPLDVLQLLFDPPAIGADCETEFGCCFRLCLPLAGHLEDGAARAERLQAASGRLSLAPEALVLVDIETAGLATAPLFLIGALSVEADGLTLTQYFARGYEEEAALLHLFCRSLAPRRMVVTFNGASFDLPYLRDRSIYHRLPAPLFPDHLDLLPAARRQFRGLLPDCRLQTLEQHVCRRRRLGDVSGSAIPQLYHDYVRTGNWPLLLPVFHHNALDLLTLAELLPHLLDT
jgi:uncharacterized protein YprB with RNaseH-like and TPR domain